MDRNYLRIFSFIFILLAVIFLFALPAFANGPATVYKVTLTKFELWNGTEWITAFTGTSTTLDIASAADNDTSAGNFLSGLVIPDGTYTKVKATPSGTFTIKGDDGAGNYTTAVVGVGTGSTPTNNAALAAECTVTIAGVVATESALSTPITVTDGAPNHRVRVKFNTSAAIQLQGGELFPAVPTVTVSVI